MASATDAPTHPTDVEKEPVVEDATTGVKKIVPKGIEEKLLKHSHDADAAMKAFEGMEGQVVELTEEKSKALLRKIDWHLMPVSPFLWSQLNVFMGRSVPVPFAKVLTFLDHVHCLWLKLP